MKEIVLLDVYEHYKGNKYQVIALPKHTETGEKLVVYRNIKTMEEWARPEKMFNSYVVVDRKRRKRFKLKAK